MSDINKDVLHTNIKEKEISREEIINVFNILYRNKLITETELHRASMLAKEKYKSMK